MRSNTSIQRAIAYYALMAASTVTIAVVTTHVSIFEKGLVAAPLLLVVTITALVGDYYQGVFCIVCCMLALAYTTPPKGFVLSSMAVIRLIEFFVASAIACGLAWRVRGLLSKTRDLVSNINQLNQQLIKLQKQQHKDKHALMKLKLLNKQLDNLVSEFVDDDNYWQERLVKGASKTRHFKRYMH